MKRGRSAEPSAPPAGLAVFGPPYATRTMVHNRQGVIGIGVGTGGWVARPESSTGVGRVGRSTTPFAEPQGVPPADYGCLRNT